jgi:hypothetical protein
VRVQAKLAHLAGPFKRVQQVEPRTEGAWEWEENLFVAEEEDDLGDSDSCFSDDGSRSTPPSPIFDSTHSTINTYTINDFTATPAHEESQPTQEYGFARVLFAEHETEPEGTDRLSSSGSYIEEEEEYPIYAVDACYAELYPGEEDDDAYFAELPIFGDTPSSVVAHASMPIPTPTLNTSLEHPTSTPRLDSISPPSPFLWSPPPLTSAPSSATLAVPQGFALDYVLMNEEIEESDWEVEELGGDSADDGYYDDPPCFLSPAPTPPPSQLAYLSSDEEEEEEESSEDPSHLFVHLPSLRVVPLAARERGIPDWRDWLRRQAIARSAYKQQLPCWLPL